jgi:hypothetical protein
MESQRHRDLKKYISAFFQDRGWTASQESAGASFRADVFVLGPHKRRAAFEVELSKPSYQAISRRQKKYQQAGISAVWLLGRQPRQGKSSSELPYFLLGPAVNKIEKQLISVDQRWLNIDSFLQALLAGRLSWRPGQIELSRSGYLLALPGNCWNCQQNFTAISGIQAPTCRCGKYLGRPEELPADVFKTIIERSPLLASLPNNFGPRAALRPRRNKAGTIANHCPHCRKIQGNYFLPPVANSEFVIDSEPGIAGSGPAWGQAAVVAMPEGLFRRRPPGAGRGHWCLQPASRR